MIDQTGIYVTLSLGGIALIYEFYALATKKQLLSDAIWNMIAGRPFIPFLAGFLCGHFFWQAKP